MKRDTPLQRFRKIKESKTTHLPTAHPIRFYGGIDGYCYVIWWRRYFTPKGTSGNEFAICRVKDYTYDFDKKQLFLSKDGERKALLFTGLDFIDSSRLNEVKTSRELRGDIFTSFTYPEQLLYSLLEPKMQRTKPANKVN